MRTIYWESNEESYERPFLEVPPPMEYFPERPLPRELEEDDDNPRVIIIEI